MCAALTYTGVEAGTPQPLYSSLFLLTNLGKRKALNSKSSVPALDFPLMFMPTANGWDLLEDEAPKTLLLALTF